MTKKDFILSIGLASLLCANPFFVHSVHSQTDSLILDLQAIYQLADKESRQINVSRHALSAATQALQQARNNMFPHVNINISGSYIGDATLMSRSFSTSGTTQVILPGLGPQTINNGLQPSPHWGNIFSVEATQVLYAGGALTAGMEMAKIGEEIATIEVLKNKQDVRFMLTSYFLDLVKLQNQLQVIDNHIRLTEAVLKQMQSRERVGIVLHNDLTRYELQLKQLLLTQKQLCDAQSIISHQMQNALHLSASIIKPDTVELSALYSLLQQSTANNNWHEQAQNSNLNLQQAVASSKMSEQSIKATRAASIPTFALVVKDELFGPYTNDLIPVNANVNTWFIGIGMKYDIGSLWHNNHAINKAKKIYDADIERVALMRENIDNQVHSAYTHYLTSFTEVETQQKQVQLADENYAIVEKRYNHELALLTDLLDAASMKLQADMSLVNARIALLYNYFQLRYITHSM